MMDLSQALTPPKTIAIVGLSDKKERPSYQVATYLQKQGFTIIPVNPLYSVWNSIVSYPSVSAIPSTITIDIVDIFRQSDAVVPIITELINTQRTPLVWMQEGVVSEEGKRLAEASGMTVIMNACLMKHHAAKKQV